MDNVDFGALAANSASLERPNLSLDEDGNIDQPILIRTMKELSAVSGSMAKSEKEKKRKTTNSYHFVNGAGSNKLFDASKLDESTCKLELLANSETPIGELHKIKENNLEGGPPMPRIGLSLSNYLEAYDNWILQDVSFKSNRMIQNDLDVVRDKVFQRKYETERKDILGRLSGCRTIPIKPTSVEASKELPSVVVAFKKIKKQNYREMLSECIALCQQFKLDQTPLTALRILSNMLSSCQENQDMKNLRIAFGSLGYFCSQYKDYIQGAVQAVNMNTTPNFLAYVTAFLQLKNRPGSIWEVLYYCLRCGDARTAFIALSEIPYSDVIDQSVIDLLEHLANLQTSNSFSFLHTFENRDTLFPIELLNPVMKIYQRFKARNFSNDVFQLGTLALLSLVEPLPCELITTIEDYYFSHLWLSVFDSKRNHFEDFIEKIKFWGPTYFEPKSSTSITKCWSYAIPLLVCQQFQSFLIYLVDHSSTYLELLFATHMALVLHRASIPLVDFVSSPQDNSSDKLLTRILITYAQTYQFSDPILALDYLVLIPNNMSREATKQVVQLIVATNAIESLGGKLHQDGSRIIPSGALDTYFSPVQVSSHLFDAAKNLLSQDDDTKIHNAKDLLALSGNYGAFLELFNEQLSKRLVLQSGQQESESRTFWKDHSIQFHNTHLKKQRTYVVTVLENDNQLHYAKTFELLLNLVTFFDRIHDQQWETAWLLISRLQLLPKSHEEISWAINHFSTLDNNIKRNFHFIVLASMETLQQQYMSLKEKYVGPTHFQELRLQAKLLVTFAGLIHFSSSSNNPGRFSNSDIYAQIARKEAFMIA